MRNLTKVIALAVLVPWVLAAMHCKLEVMPGFEFLASCCQTESMPAEADCAEDGCGPVESGAYRVEDQSGIVPEPLSVCRIHCLEAAPVTDMRSWLFTRTEAPPEFPKAWHFRCRTVMPVRAPSIVT